jgi:mRNA-degrading endonuclease HigB of HigAB toxin-antitoxin module
VVVASVDADGSPASFAIKAYGEVISGKVETEFVTIGSYEKFMKIALAGDNITEVVSVFDVDGHEYYEVDYLSQNIVYKTVRNRKEDDKEDAPYILREMIVPRRFTIEHQLSGDTYLQFGYGSESNLKTQSSLIRLLLF